MAQFQLRDVVLVLSPFSVLDDCGLLLMKYLQIVSFNPSVSKFNSFISSRYSKS